MSGKLAVSDNDRDSLALIAFLDQTCDK